MNSFSTRLAALLLLASGFLTSATAQNSGTSAYQLDLNTQKLGIDISPTLNGIFYEDINQSNDGGICAQLIQNNSFQAFNVIAGSEYGPAGNKIPEFSTSPDIIYGWTVVKKGDAAGKATTVDEKPLVKYTEYYPFDKNDPYDDALKYKQYCIRFDIETPGKGFGLAANGYGITKYGPDREGNYYSNNTQTPSIAANKGSKYDLSLYLQGNNYQGQIAVYLEDTQGKIISNVLTFKKLKNSWVKYKGVLKANQTADVRLVISGNAAGTFYLDFVTLIPEKSQLWKNGKFGPFRKDLLVALEKLKPTFMRFPGGCATESPNYWGQYFWKNTIGPAEERVGTRNHWGTWTSQYIGFYEYFLMAEGLGATPLPVINNGVTCQFAGRSYIAPLATEADRKRFYDIHVKDALDLIEFCNGDATTEWGKKRIAFGHPKPFGLKFLAVGNENSGDAFWKRFDIISKAVKAKYPDITLITTSGARASGGEFNDNYAIIDQKYADSYVDEHYYSNDNWFYTNTNRYNPGMTRGNQGNTYDRSKATRVFVGEFSNNATNNAYVSTMAEAAFFTGLERNSDMVKMAAYAPLFCKKGFNKWNANLIWFDNRGLWRTSNYYYLSLFANNVGNKAFETSPFLKKGDQTADAKVYTSSTIDTKTGTVYVKVVNAEKLDKATTINLKGAENQNYSATLEYISSENTGIKNQGDQNYYHGSAQYPQVNYNEAITPQLKQLGKVKGSFQVNIPLNSVCVLKLSPVK